MPSAKAGVWPANVYICICKRNIYIHNTLSIYTYIYTFALPLFVYLVGVSNGFKLGMSPTKHIMAFNGYHSSFCSWFEWDLRDLADNTGELTWIFIGKQERVHLNVSTHYHQFNWVGGFQFFLQSICKCVICDGGEETLSPRKGIVTTTDRAIFSFQLEWTTLKISQVQVCNTVLVVQQTIPSGNLT